jgi:hypothetical protein
MLLHCKLQKLRFKVTHFIAEVVTYFLFENLNLFTSIAAYTQARTFAILALLIVR